LSPHLVRYLSDETGVNFIEETCMVSTRSVSDFPNQWRRLMWSLLGAVSIAAMDQTVKLAVLAIRPQVPVIPGLFALSFGTNTGVAFGLFQGFPLGVTVLGGAILVAVLIYLIRVAHVATPLERTALSLLLGGASGNLIDRVRFGYVVDYLDFFVGQYHWPAFNLADSAINIGVGCLIFLSVRGSAAVPRPPGG
jgi:signal peptidase II